MRVTIITPTYNSERFLRDTLESVKKQTYTEIEHIIIDNYSKDHTKEICSLYRNIFIQKSDNSMYEGLNNGIQRSSGDIICFLNSDDIYPDNKTIEKAVGAFKKDQNIKVLYGKCIMADQDLKFLYVHQPEKVIDFNFARRRLFIISHPAVFIRKKIFEKYGLYDLNLKIMADFEYWLRLLKNKVPLTYYDEILAVFRRHTANLSLTKEKSTEIQYIAKKYGYDVSPKMARTYQVLDNILNFHYIRFHTVKCIKSKFSNLSGFVKWKT